MWTICSSIEDENGKNKCAKAWPKKIAIDEISYVLFYSDANNYFGRIYHSKILNENYA